MKAQDSFSSSMLSSSLGHAAAGLWKITSILIAILCVSCPIVLADGEPPSKVAGSLNAYATILYVGTPRDYEYYVAARVLLQSLARLKVDADLVLIASQNTSQVWLQTFIKEGVRVIPVENVPNPYMQQNRFNRRFLFTLNKLLAWTLVGYERIVMLDADNLILRNPDELFQCGQFCAAFIDPCIFHTGLFVLEPSRDVFNDMLERVHMRSENRDGADQGFLTSYFPDLLDMPMFHPPNNGSRLRGHYRLPFGYQMDASYYYLRLKWRVPCGPNSVVTFPGASWLKPWYWWSWPILPLGLSWHDLRASTIGYREEVPVLITEAIIYLAIFVTATSLRQAFPHIERMPHYGICKSKSIWFDYGFYFHIFIVKMMIPVCIVGSFLMPMAMVPTTAYPLTGWGLSLLGSLALLMVTVHIFHLPVAPVLIPWLLSFGSLLVMASPYYKNGIIRAFTIMAFAAFATPFLWWSLRKVTGSRVVYIEKEPLKSPSVLLKLC